MLKKIIFISLLASFNSFAESSYFMTINSNLTKNVKIIGEDKPITKKGPPFWMYDLGAGALSNQRLSYYDRSSLGEAHVYFNMGQLPFIGDPNGYEPFDINYSTDKLLGNFAYVNYPKGTYYAPYNIYSITYNEEKTSGKYYLEIYIEGSPHADNICFNSCMYSGYYGSSTYKTLAYYSAEVPYYKGTVLAGSVIQVWMNIDDGKIAMIKLGTNSNDYFEGSYILNE